MTADLAVFAAHGCMGISAVTALTVQSTLGVEAVRAVERDFLSRALKLLMEDMPAAGVKVGMLASEDNVGVVIDFLRRLRGARRNVPVVLDPVVRSSSGAELLSSSGLALLRSSLLPLVDWVTPNLAELAALMGCVVETESQMEWAGEGLAAEFRGLNVIVTGGHLAAADDLVVEADGRREWLRGEKIPSRSTHGTGCAFSSALLCGLVRGLDGVEAGRGAKSFVAEAIRRAVPVGGGHGPMNLSWPLREGKSG